MSRFRSVLLSSGVLCASLLMTLAHSRPAFAEMRTVVIDGDLDVDGIVTYSDTHLQVLGNVNLLRNGSLILDRCVVEVVGKFARQYAYNWRGGTLTTRDTTIGGTLRDGVAQQANFNLNDGLWTAVDTTVRYTYGIQFSYETVGRLRATRLKQGPNPDSIIVAGKGDVELADSTYMIALNLQLRGDKATLDLPNDTPITRTIDGSNMPGATFRLKLNNVTVPDFWFLFFYDVSMTGKPTEITLKGCKKFLPSIMGTDLTGEVTLGKGLERPLTIGNLTIRRDGNDSVEAFAMGLYLRGKRNDLVLNGPIVICELMMFEGGRVTLKGTKTYDAACTATTLDLHGSSQVELIDARLGRPLQHGPIAAGDPLAAVIGQVTVGDQAQLVGRNVSLGRLHLITRGDGRMRFGPYTTTDTLDKTQHGGKIEFDP
ncbi:MAG TPA: hypothetical protein VHC22_14300 [Pirellulales bacterium]|nr:hypothetical protein [Pirellulales bacterium]